MPPTPVLTRAGRARSVALPASTAARPLGRRARYRATALAGGLAVLLSGSVGGHLPPAVGSAATVVGSAATVVGSAATLRAATSGLSAATGTLGAVARTGGQR